MLDDVSDKFKLFIGHQLRYKVQNQVIDDVYKSMLDAEPETFEVLKLDYKMKWEPKKQCKILLIGTG